MFIINKTIDILAREPNLVRLQDPLLVIGDIHGQFFDLLKILELGGSPEKNKYLFLGDYVDRGAFALEVIILIYCLKLNYPDLVFLLRGNHECRQLTSYFTFRMECIQKYDSEVYEKIMDSFDCLPVAATVNDNFLSVHGGLSPHLKNIRDIDQVYRFEEPPKDGIFCDLLWADPIDNENGVMPSSYIQNTTRGCSYLYGADAVNDFLQQNDLIALIRAHEVQADGYKMHRWAGDDDFPLVITVFSAPNYCDFYNNKGAIIRFTNNTLNVQQFNYSQHPYLLPNFMNVFNWSSPFIIEKVMAMLYNILKPRYGEKNIGLDSVAKKRLIGLESQAKESKKNLLKNKVNAVSRMMRMFKTLREEHEAIVLLKGMCPDNKIPRGLLLEGRTALMVAVDRFRHARMLDIDNERRPR
mmetsp:Transcript_29133/g.28849  ORF Transcript_29133/g.28849 Transcript_29133/m.28849 type:complete len:412 (+) Transcript_29133:180-1415(+)